MSISSSIFVSKLQMEFETKVLLGDLQKLTLNIISQVEEMESMKLELLNHKTDQKSWSALECLEHLNRYGRFYIPEIENRIAAAPKETISIFKSGKLGNYFARSMRPGPKMKKINTFKSMNPNGSKLNKLVIEEFLNHQRQLLKILDKAKNVDLSRTKTSTSISKWIKLRLGDTLRVVIHHNQRHISQAQRALS